MGVQTSNMFEFVTRFDRVQGRFLWVLSRVAALYTCLRSLKVCTLHAPRFNAIEHWNADSTSFSCPHCVAIFDAIAQEEEAGCQAERDQHRRGRRGCGSINSAGTRTGRRRDKQRRCKSTGDKGGRGGWCRGCPSGAVRGCGDA